MPQVRTEDVTLHVEVDGSGEPVTVVAHGLTNNRNELAVFTPLVSGTKVRFDFRGHGRSSAPPTGYAFVDFARDLDAVASAYGATRAIGTSLGAGAIMNLLSRQPDRFERTVWLMPAGLDVPFPFKERWDAVADQLEGKTAEEALEAILSAAERAGEYLRMPWKREIDRLLWDHDHPDGVARAMRGVIRDWPVPDREMLRTVTCPVLLICVEGDEIHPAELGRILHELMPASHLVIYPSEEAMFAGLPELVPRVDAFLLGDDEAADDLG
ncbi:MAG TPA: alpha/beta hydrolase [Actinomycetota bacterium]|nr:alpha/beta hydrolase [Actinomycetota bacterium]